MNYAQKTSKETPNAAAIFTALETRQSPRFCISSRVLCGMPVISERRGIEIFFSVLISLSFIQIFQGDFSPCLLLLFVFSLCANFTCIFFNNMQHIVSLALFYEQSKHLKKHSKFFVGHKQLLNSKMFISYHVLTWLSSSFLKIIGSEK